MKYLIVFFVLNTFSVKGQVESKNIIEYIHNRVSKNFLVYNIRNASQEVNGALPEEVLEMGPEFFYGLISNEGFNLIMKIDTSDLIYPLKDFKVYKVFIRRYEYERGISRIQANHLFTKKHFLVAVDAKDESHYYIKYVSGQFYPTRISEDFGVNIKDPVSFIEYLRFRTYSDQVENIKLKQQLCDTLIYTGYSQVKKSKVKIILKKDDLERPIVVEE